MSVDAQAVPLTRRRNAIIVSFALGGMTFAAFGARLPSIQDSLGVSKTVLGTSLMGITVGSLVGLSLAAWLHARVGARAGITGSLLLVAAGITTIGAAVGPARSLPLTVTGLVMVGLAIGLLDVLINVEGAAIEQLFGHTLMPLFHACWSAGAILGAGIGALSAAVGLSVPWQFAGEAVVLVAAAGYVAAGVPPQRSGDSAATDDPAGPAPSRAERLKARLRVWASGRLLLIGLVMLGAELGEGSANNWLTLAAREDHGHSEAIAAAFFVLFAAGETAARLLGGPLVDRFGRVATVRTTSLLGVLGLALFILTDRWWFTALGVLLWAVGVSMGFPLGMTAAAQNGPHSAAQVSVVATIGYAANLAGPPSLGLLADRVGLLDALWVVVALLAFAAVCAGAVRARQT